jgi:hypothetical protein
VNAFVLDPATMIPVDAQLLRPGVTASGSIDNSNPDSVSLTSLFIVGLGGSSPISIGSISAGNAVLTLHPPLGFSTPSIRQQLRVKIQTPSLRIAANVLRKDTQSVLSLDGITGPPRPLTLTSGDPSRLLISTTDRAAVGSESVTIPSAPILPSTCRRSKARDWLLSPRPRWLSTTGRPQSVLCLRQSRWPLITRVSNQVDAGEWKNAYHNSISQYTDRGVAACDGP